MTINPLDHIPKKPFVFKEEDKIILHPPEFAVHTSDVPLGRWYELEKDEKPIKLKKSKKTYNVKIIGNIYDSKPT